METKTIETSGEKFMSNGGAFGVLLGRAEWVAKHPSRDGALLLANGLLDFARVVGLAHILDEKSVAK